MQAILNLGFQNCKFFKFLFIIVNNKKNLVVKKLVGGGARPLLAPRAPTSLFHTSKIVERLGNVLCGNDDILFYSEDFDKSHSLLIKDIFLLQVFFGIFIQTFLYILSLH